MKESSDDVEACIGVNALSSSPEKESVKMNEREKASQVRYKSAYVAAVGSVPL